MKPWVVAIVVVGTAVACSPFGNEDPVKGADAGVSSSGTSGSSSTSGGALADGGDGPCGSSCPSSPGFCDLYERDEDDLLNGWTGDGESKPDNRYFKISDDPPLVSCGRYFYAEVGQTKTPAQTVKRMLARTIPISSTTKRVVIDVDMRVGADGTFDPACTSGILTLSGAPFDPAGVFAGFAVVGGTFSFALRGGGVGANVTQSIPMRAPFSHLRWTLAIGASPRVTVDVDELPNVVDEAVVYPFSGNQATLSLGVGNGPQCSKVMAFVDNLRVTVE